MVRHIKFYESSLDEEKMVFLDACKEYLNQIVIGYYQYFSRCYNYLSYLGVTSVNIVTTAL